MSRIINLMQKMLTLPNCVCFLALVFCFLTKLSQCVGFTFELPDNSEECFYDEIKKNTSAYLEFQVSAGGQLDVDVQLKDPRNHVIYEQQRATFGSHQFTAESTGVYTACFSNKFSSFSHKFVYMGFQVGDEPALPGIDDHATVLTPMENSSQSVHKSFNEILDAQRHQRLRDAQGQKRADKLNERVMWYSSLETGAVLLIGIVHILIVKMLLKLYGVSDGPPSLAVRKVFEAQQNPFGNMNEEYAKMIPQKEIPVLADNGFHLQESIAIMQYLCDNYSPESALYPKDPAVQAIVNQRLYSNLAFYYIRIGAYVMAPIFFYYERSPMGREKVNNAQQVYETYLERSKTKYAANDNLTIADFPLVTSTVCLEAIDFDITDYPLVKKWYETFKKEYPSFRAIGKGGLDEIADFEKNPPDLSTMDDSIP